MTDLSETMRIFEPFEGIFAYYDGRIAGKRLHSETENWLDDGAYSLGIATYALVFGQEALVYDTHTSVDHARAVRRHLEGLGVTLIRVVLSHWHTDHIAGNAVFKDCEIIALKATAEMMEKNKASLESGNPPISPVVMPTRLFEDRLSFHFGHRSVELLHFNIHSADGCVLWLADEGILLAGDTVEDTVTYISEPAHISTHIRELERLHELPITHLLPDHGAPDIIAGGGYSKALIEANRSYLLRLIEHIDEPAIDNLPLKAFVAEDIADGRVRYFAPYEDVHRKNIAAVRGARK